MTTAILAALLVLGADQAPPQATRPDDAAAVVALGDCSSPVLPAVARSFRAALRGSGVPALSEAETADRVGGTSSRSLRDLDQALSTARDQFLNGQPEPAFAALQQVERDLRRLRPAPERWELERRVLSSLAQIRASSDRAAARAFLEQIAAVDPAYEPDRAVFPPSFRAEYRKVRDGLQESGRSRLEVATEPPGLPVYVGGHPAGASPLTLQLPPGTYRVEVDWGHRGLVRTVTLGPTAQRLVLSRAAEGAILPDAGPCVLAEPDRRTALGRVAKQLGVSRLFAIRVEGSGPDERVVATELDARSGAEKPELSEPAVPPSPAAEAAGRLAARIAAPPPPPGQGLRTASYVVGSVGLAAAGVGTYFIISGNSTLRDLETQYQQGNGSFPAGSEQAVKAKSDDAKSKRTLGVILAGVGGAAVVIGVTLFIVSGHQAPEGETAALVPYFSGDGGGVALTGRF